MGNSAVNSNTTSTTVTVLSDSSSSSSSLKKTSQKSLKKDDETSKSGNKLVDILTRKPSAKPAFFIKVNSLSSTISSATTHTATNSTSRTLSTSSTCYRPTSSLLSTSTTARTISSTHSTTSSLDNLPSKPKRGLSMPRLGSLRNKSDNKVYPQSTSSLFSTTTTLSTVGSQALTIKTIEEDRTFSFNDETDHTLTRLEEDSENCNSDPDCVSSTSSEYFLACEIPILCITNPENQDVTSNFYQPTQPKHSNGMELNDVDDEV
ncbi:predicted protein [Naegleria gruberi]|uniref:Predicted protein n=1 Tax=Naegleria gruberi TaxID=5762 RepID=D2VI39_NAEGR|nr:uncharacterized protein NAEGRDRAFT_49729 [Naegleria gruberi]EFC43524.1 predicted protein [Naegleria gruberi]|eukprot:XP_002676268.1 predicted protein [Naegleria gruberi strain NEG-M]